MLKPSDKESFDAAQQTAVSRESELLAAEAEAAEAKRRIEMFQNALAEVQLFKSKTDVAILQAQDQVSRLGAEADDIERRYHTAYMGEWWRVLLAYIQGNRWQDSARLSACG